MLQMCCSSRSESDIAVDNIGYEQGGKGNQRSDSMVSMKMKVVLESTKASFGPLSQLRRGILGSHVGFPYCLSQFHEN